MIGLSDLIEQISETHLIFLIEIGVSPYSHRSTTIHSLFEGILSVSLFMSLQPLSTHSSNHDKRTPIIIEKSMRIVPNSNQILVACSLPLVLLLPPRVQRCHRESLDAFLLCGGGI
ncbi:hypothetical protein BLNAU_23268 [Blattamonas nauphoetae]|uniref:Uncharacterized protein n=1 Tax=Blattamonas nauphoetae TaxID=2049346 RepID=A0ABQ9WQN7_9EUKA|nr:hypothetical protein BLNAU_23268 [Blattamonas nauphoetae]